MPDCPRFNRRTAVSELSFREPRFLEYPGNGFKIELRREIENSEILVVKCLYCFGLFGPALSKMLIEVQVRLSMPVYIHRQKCGQLNETGINAPSCSGITGRHAVD